MNNELRILILFSVIVKIYNFVVNMLKSGAERTRAWRTSEVTVQNVKKTVYLNNKDNEPATSTSAQRPPLASISDNLQYSDFPVIQKFHFYCAS
jgi:hypothetical protein